MQPKPLILSAVHGLQLVGATPVQVNQFCIHLHLHHLHLSLSLSTSGLSRCFDLVEVAAPPLDTVTALVIHVSEEIFFLFFFLFLERTPNDSPG